MNIVFDLDGTLVDISHRLHFINGGKKDWRAFFLACGDDVPIFSMIKKFRQCYVSNFKLHIWTGRSDLVRRATIEHLIGKCGITPDMYNLQMRKEGDFTPSAALKEQWLDEFLKKSPSGIAFAFDDEQRVFDMWKRRGVWCFLCGPEGIIPITKYPTDDMPHGKAKGITAS